MAHPVMGPDQPGLEVGKNEVDGGKKGFGFIRIAALGNGMVVVAPFAQASVGAQSSVTTSVPVVTVFSTKPQSALAVRSGATARRTRPA